MKSKKIFKLITIAIISLVVLGLTLPLLNLYAQENLEAPLGEVMNKLDELVELKDDDTLPEKEKEKREILVRQEILNKIVDLSLLELENLENRINSLNLELENQAIIAEKFLEILENNKKYSKNLKEDNEKKDITLDEVKNLAQEYKDWRENNYSKYVKKIFTFILVFQEKRVLEIANTRLDKIMSDLERLEKANVLKKEDTWKFINASIDNLANAQISNSKAETIIIKLIEKEIINVASSTLLIINANTTKTLEKPLVSATTTTMATTTVIADIPEVSTSTVEIINTIGVASSTVETINITETTSSIEEIINEEDDARSLIEVSLQEIKNAYNNFISISNKVKLKLKIK
ncbi:hypothetical protein KJ671_02600 [Patescibacteria group bacterium]|nr:hypothetical protein [Patescibacteria group bacterium]